MKKFDENKRVRSGRDGRECCRKYREWSEMELDALNAMNICRGLWKFRIAQQGFNLGDGSDIE